MRSSEMARLQPCNPWQPWAIVGRMRTRTPRAPVARPDPTTTPTLRASEVAAIFDVGLDSIYRAAQSGELPCLRIGVSYRFPTTAILRMLDDAGEAVG